MPFISRHNWVLWHRLGQCVMLEGMLRRQCKAYSIAFISANLKITTHSLLWMYHKIATQALSYILVSYQTIITELQVTDRFNFYVIVLLRQLPADTQTVSSLFTKWVENRSAQWNRTPKEHNTMYFRVHDVAGAPELELISCHCLIYTNFIYYSHPANFNLLEVHETMQHTTSQN